MKGKISAHNVTKTFEVGDQEINVLKGISFDIEPGEFVVLVGPSGCGKSTMLHALLGLEPPTSGNIQISGYNIDEHINLNSAAKFRKKHIGFVHQQANWVNSITVRENVAFPLILLGVKENEALNISVQKLKKVGMLGWADRIPTELSSGQQQRVALARALVNDPDIIVTDEPTGNLDYDSGKRMMDLLQEMNDVHGKTILMVTHELSYLKYSDRAIKMFDGRIVKQLPTEEVPELAKRANGHTK